ncbi:MAG: toxin TcdB middle/N-terminal domain-containing protein, partial [Gammaproteobacteria bacterium]
KIVAYGAAGNGPAYFIAQTKSGQTIQYGASTDARILATGKTTALVWNANRITDTVGNYLTVTYTQNTATGEYYPQRIDYAGNDTQGAPSSSVQFVYATRTDTFTGYVGGSTVSSTQRMTNVQVFEGATKIRDYGLTYDSSAATQRSRVAMIQECDGAATPSCLPATTVGWQGGGSNNFAPATAWATATGWAGQNYYGFQDMNGDGLADFWWVPNNTAQIKVQLSTGAGFAPATVWTTATGWAGADYYGFQDMNGDGLADFWWVPSNTAQINVQLSTGTGFAPATAWATATGWAGKGYYGFQDMNGDGLADFWWVPSNTAQIKVQLSTGTSFAPATIWATAAGWAGQNYYGFQDMNGDGLADFWWVPSNTAQINVASGLSSLDKAASLTTGLGNVTSLSYKPLTNSAGTVYTKGTGAIFPQQDFQGPLYVVSQYTTSDGVGGSYPITYSYQGARVNLQGRGITGFSQITATDTRTGIVTQTSYADTTNANNWPTFGLATSVTKTYGSSTISSQTNTLNYYRYGTANAYYYFPYVSKTVVTNYELPPTGSSYVVSTVTTNNAYHGSCPTTDAYCDLTSIAVTTTAGADTFTKTTNNTYDYSGISNWILGRLTNAQVTSTLPSGASLTRESAFTYYTGSGLLWTEVIEPNGNTGSITNMKQTTTYSYDGFGNKTGATVSGADGISRPATAANNASTAGAPYAYSAGRFETGLTNAARQGETRVYDARFGTVATLTGPNGLSTKWLYDSFGRKQIEIRADNTITIWSYSLCGTCANAKYYVTQTTSGAPTVTVYYDLLDREVRTETVGYNGAPIYKDTIYNNLGQIAKVSRPYYSSDVPYWTYFGYDTLGRVISQSLPTQASTAGTPLGKTDYKGLTTVITQYRDGLALTTTQVKDAIGELVAVTDANNNITRYAYDPFGNLTTVTDPALNVTSMTYDIRGRKLSMTDPDMGYWQYGYNTVGDLTQQIDANGETVIMGYDRLGRMYIRNEAEGITFWTYDDTTLSGAKAKGKLSQVTWPGGSRTFVYDSKGRPSTETTTLSGVNYTLTTTYDSSSRVDTITYPSGFSVRNNYNANGYLTSVTNTATGFAYWTAPQYTAAGQVSAFTLGNNLTTVNQYDPGTGLIMGISTGVGTGSATQYLNYNYDTLGNLLLRYTDRIELFSYDNLNRMTSASIPGVVTKSLAYDSLGNITSKSDVGSYTYDPQHIHAVKTAGSGSYTYDANGNQKTGPNGRNINYTSFNQPLSLTQGGKTNSFVYDGDHQRVMETTSDGTTISIHPRIDLGAHYEEVHKPNGTVEYKNYIYAGKEAIAVYTTRSTNVNDTRYFHKDHLGSIDTITNETGGIVERLSYDAWGKRRNGNWTDATSPIFSITHHGFTGHEHLDDVGLINMNGRIYDPTIARFLSADPTVQSPGNPQTLNRYSYANNNPLSYTDPSGYGWFSSWWKNVLKPILIAAVAIAAFYLALPYAWSFYGSFISSNALLGAATLATAGAVGGFVGGFVGSGGNVQAGINGAISGAIMGGVAGFAGGMGWSPGGVNSVIAHAIGGGVNSVVQGQKFGPGALSAGFMDGLTPRIDNIGGTDGTAVTKRVVASAVVGGTTSSLGGRKFANGADTFGFLRLFGEADSYYQRNVGHAPSALPGENRPGQTTYEPDPLTGRQPPGTEQMNIVGNNDLTSFCRQGSTCSKILNVVPGINATSGLHDYWFNVPGHPAFTLTNNVGTMLPAAGISYGAVIGNLSQGWETNPVAMYDLLRH